MRVDIIEKQQIFKKAIFEIEATRLRHERFDGSMSDEIMRLNLERGDGVAAVVHNTDDDTIILIEQFRYSTYEKGPGWLIELPAGIVEAGEDPAATMIREIEEEIGFAVDAVEPISTFYLSPGGSSERIFLFYVAVSPDQDRGNGGGKDDEGEDIRRVVLPVTEALGKVKTGEIMDAKTLVGLQWLKLR
jgi:nudix-type nucleoside diphosphatase (YffH/AdpP family)